VPKATQRRTHGMDTTSDFVPSGDCQRIMSDLQAAAKELEAEASCRKLVAQLNGRAWGESRLKHGSVAIFAPAGSLES